MNAQHDRRIWKVRTVKNYPEAHNHVLIGQVLQLTDAYIQLDCRTYHFGKTINGVKDIKTGNQGIRILPWSRIELINELPSTFDYSSANLISKKDGKIALNDGAMECILSPSCDNRY